MLYRLLLVICCCILVQLLGLSTSESLPLCPPADADHIPTCPPSTQTNTANIDWELVNNSIIMCYSSYCCWSSLYPWTCPDSICGGNPFFETLEVKEVVSPADPTGFSFKGGLQYFVANQTDTGTFYLVFRGSDDKVNWLTDLASLIPEHYPSSNDPEKVGLGFKDAWLDVKQHVVASLRDSGCVERSSCNLVILGHSLGGAIATLAAYDFAYEIGTQNFWDINVMTFGSPRVGNCAFQSKYENAGINSLRFVNYNDTIPHYPYSYPHFGLEYVHVNEEVWMDNPESPWQNVTCPTTEDPNCSRSVNICSLVYNVEHINETLWEHRRYMGYDLETFCDAWVPVIDQCPPNPQNYTSTPTVTETPTPTPSATPNVTVTPSPTPNPFQFPIISQNITSNWLTYINVWTC
ncbi:hypothetical protein DFA_05707 [Cavenderia fasciculata]|uniref:Fungal lipase-type domain-containing protein n=1 Tax=Cavenderia fasciculata TaxID=261658 RepID=F4PM74_CACFS|nr:uncharacterized protein DFA_05707 [Cavenderia fasciculata]EGG23574.1 hypothetical protein DFA_05707 [Cavenderia fasciculata]|eukprot:XP_004361425.1 hypothetical protein DFA_05707 [Cavenderia fasciculata]